MILDHLQQDPRENTSVLLSIDLHQPLEGQMPTTSAIGVSMYKEELPNKTKKTLDTLIETIIYKVKVVIATHTEEGLKKAEKVIEALDHDVALSSIRKNIENLKETKTNTVIGMIHDVLVSEKLYNYDCSEPVRLIPSTDPDGQHMISKCAWNTHNKLVAQTVKKVLSQCSHFMYPTTDGGCKKCIESQQNHDDLIMAEVEKRLSKMMA